MNTEKRLKEIKDLRKRVELDLDNLFDEYCEKYHPIYFKFSKFINSSILFTLFTSTVAVILIFLFRLDQIWISVIPAIGIVLIFILVSISNFYRKKFFKKFKDFTFK